MVLFIIGKILIIFAFVGIGFVACKVRFLDEQSIPYLTQLMVNVTAPCMLITSIAGSPFSGRTAWAAVQMLVGTAIFFVAGIFVAAVFLKMIAVPKEDTGVYNMLITTQNSGFMGFPLAKGIFGEQGLFFMVLSNLVMNIYMYTAGLLQINMGSPKKKSNWKNTVKSLLNPCSVAAAAGLVLLVAQIKLPQFIDDVITPLGDATIPVSMVVLGVQLATSHLRAMLKNRKLILVTGVTLLVWPVLTFLAVNWLPLYTYVKIIMIYVAALPGMVMLVALAEQEGQNAQVAAEGVALTTFFSMITLPVVTVLLKLYYGVS